MNRQRIAIKTLCNKDHLPSKEVFLKTVVNPLFDQQMTENQLSLFSMDNFLTQVELSQAKEQYKPSVKDFMTAYAKSLKGEAKNAILNCLTEMQRLEVVK